MAVGLRRPSDLARIAGIRIGTATAAIRDESRDDLALIEIAEGAHTAAVFTRNAFCAAPVRIARQHLEAVPPRFLLINAGNANAGTGEAGLADAVDCCKAVAAHADCAAEAVLPFSTGVIGERMPVDRVRGGIPLAFAALKTDGWEAGARAIMTTDTVPKGLSRRFRVADRDCAVTGIAKGAGMIRPDMATMLAFLATDAAVAPDVLQYCLEQAVERSFHRITVDGDTSTNDACVLIATGGSGAMRIDATDGDDYEALRRAVDAVCETLAQSIVRDAEGATRFVTVGVREGRSVAECLQVAFAVAQSPLVKTAIFAGDPNWGRILAAVGRSGVVDLEIEKVRIFLDNVCVAQKGARATDYKEADAQRVMRKEEFTIAIALGRGAETATVCTSDLSYDYVKINAEYRT